MRERNATNKQPFSPNNDLHVSHRTCPPCKNRQKTQMQLVQDAVNGLLTQVSLGDMSREVITAEILVLYHDRSTTTTTSFKKSVTFSVPLGAGQKEVETIKIFLFQYVLPRDCPRFTVFEFSAQLSNGVLLLLDGRRELYKTYLHSSEYSIDTAKLCKLIE